MLAPKRVKFRKWQKGRLRGPALRGATIAFGEGIYVMRTSTESLKTLFILLPGELG